MISWKHSFKRLNEEYEIAKKKKQALDNLYETGRISQSTRDSFNNEILAAITEIEKQQQDLLAKIQLKTQELESQIKTLETIFANYEIQHVVGEIDDEIYQREITLLGTGLETAKHELEIIKEAANQLCPPVSVSAPMSPPVPTTEPTTEPTPPPTESEATPNLPPENVPIAPAEVEVATEPAPQEPVVTIVEAVTEQPATENTEALPAETPQPVEEPPQEAHPQEAPPEAQQEIIIEPIIEQTQCAEETPPATETTAENTENQEKA